MPLLMSLEEARKGKLLPGYENTFVPALSGIFEFTLDAEELLEFVKWEDLASMWKVKGGEAEKDLISDAKVLAGKIGKKISCKGVAGIFPAYSKEDDIYILSPSGEKLFPMLRNQKNSYSLADYIAPEGMGKKNGRDHIGVFALSCGFGVPEIVKEFEENGDSYSALLTACFADILAEAFAEYLHKKVREQLWGWGSSYEGIRPAPGYPACPDHTLKKDIFQLLDVEKRLGIILTSSYMMTPEASVCGFYFAHPDAKCMAVGVLGEDQIKDYSSRRGMKEEDLLPFIAFAR